MSTVIEQKHQWFGNPVFGIGASQWRDLNTTLGAPQQSPHLSASPIERWRDLSATEETKAVRGVVGGARAVEVVEVKVLAHGSVGFEGL